MTKDDTIRLAVEADLWDIRDDTEDPAFAKLLVSLVRFAALVAAAAADAERAECVAIVHRNADACFPGSMVQKCLDSNAAAIRARSQS